MSCVADSLRNKRLLAVNGKGGVGKSTIAAAIARYLAAEGRDVLIVELDPRESQHQLFGTQPSAGAIIDTKSGVSYQNVDPAAVLADVLKEQLGIERIVRRVVKSDVFRQVVAGVPGLTEMAVLGHAWRATGGRPGTGDAAFDVVILDAPATGHGLSLLTAPKLVSGVVKDGPFGRMAEDLCRMVGTPTECGIVSVTHAERLPVQEILEFDAELEASLGRTSDLIVVNGLYPPVPADLSGHDYGAGSPEAMWRERRVVNERQLLHLSEAWSGPLAEVPLLALERGPDLVETAAHALRNSNGSGGAPL